MMGPGKDMSYLSLLFMARSEGKNNSAIFYGGGFGTGLGLLLSFLITIGVVLLDIFFP
jgi:hypothetical protein